MITKEKLKEYASKLMFDMTDEEYETLSDEFEVILKQMELIGKIKGIGDIKPMVFPYITYKANLRDDKEEESLYVDEVLANSKSSVRNQVKVPKVVQ